MGDRPPPPRPGASARPLQPRQEEAAGRRRSRRVTHMKSPGQVGEEGDAANRSERQQVSPAPATGRRRRGLSVPKLRRRVSDRSHGVAPGGDSGWLMREVERQEAAVGSGGEEARVPEVEEGEGDDGGGVEFGSGVLGEASGGGDGDQEMGLQIARLRRLGGFGGRVSSPWGGLTSLCAETQRIVFLLRLLQLFS